MAWYRSGTVSVTNGSATVTGSGTDWVAGVGIGEAFNGPDGKVYEIASIVSATQLTLGSVYLGATASGQAYQIIPSQSYIRDLAAQAAQLVSDYASVVSNAGSGKFTDGTAAAPGIRFTADENVGIRRAGADDMRLVANGQDKVTITGSGVSIPTLTSNPTLSAGTANGVLYLNGSKVATSGSALTFDGTTLGLNAGAGNMRVGAAGDTSTHYFRAVDNGGQSFYFGIDNSAGSFFGAGAYGRSIYSEGNYPIQFVVNSAEQMRLTSTGLGIGTSSPSYKLDISGTDGITARVKSTSGSTGNYAQLILDSYNSFSGTGQAYIRGVSSASGNSDTDLTFGVNASGFGAPFEAMRINSSGNLGIGTSSPSDKLDVNGSIATSASGTASIRFKTSGTTNYSWANQYPSAGNFSLYDHSLATSVLTVSSGNLGIGTSSPRGVLDLNTTRQVKVYFGTAGTVGETPQNAGDYIANNLFVSAESAGSLTYTKTTNDAGNAIIQDFSRGITFYTGATGASTTTGTLNNFERMRIDSSGNLGLGVTPSAWQSTHKAIDVNTRGGFSSEGTATQLSLNSYYNAGWKYKATDEAALYEQYNGTHAWYTAPSGTAGNPISFTQAMTLDAGGALNVAGATNVPTINLSDTFGDVKAQFLCRNGTTGNVEVMNTKSAALVFGTNNTERARIDSSGNLLVGTTSQIASGRLCVQKTSGANNTIEAVQNDAGGYNFMSDAVDNSSTYYHFQFKQAGTPVGNITSSGSTTAYNTSSDYRLKNITGPVQNSGAYIDSLNPVEGTWKADGSTFVGLIAHEVQEVSRTQVATGEKDGAEMQAMDYSNSELIANLIAEVQALRKRVAQLEAR